jgi:two-component sensor histidine kinase
VLTPKGAQALALILHELATNAAKYGAWSCLGGTVRLSWTVGENGGLHIEWSEHGGPTVSEPSHHSLGMRLIETQVAQLGGDLALAWPAEGLRCGFRIDGEYTVRAAAAA